MPEYSKKKLVKACETLKMISENQVGTTTQKKSRDQTEVSPQSRSLLFTGSKT